jgi:hypothetical protein
MNVVDFLTCQHFKHFNPFACISAWQRIVFILDSQFSVDSCTFQSFIIEKKILQNVLGANFQCISHLYIMLTWQKQTTGPIHDQSVRATSMLHNMTLFGIQL